MTSNGVSVSSSALHKARRRDVADGGLWVNLRVEGDPDAALAAATSAVAVATEATRATDPTGTGPISALPPALTPHGPVAYLPYSDTRQALDQWATLVAGELEAAGFSGRVTAITPDHTPYEGRDELADCVAAGIVLPADYEHIQATAPERKWTRGGWLVDSTSTNQAIDHAMTFVLSGPGDVYLEHGLVQFRTHPGDAPRLFTQAVPRPPVALTRIGPGDTVHRVEFYYWGHIIYEHRGDATDLAGDAQALAARVADHAAIAAYGFVRQSWSHVVGWDSLVQRRPPKLPRTTLKGFPQVPLPQQASRVPDAYAVQLLTDEHLDNATDLTTWQVEHVASGKHMVTARELETWFGYDRPDETTLQQARRDFGSMILRPGIDGS